MADQREKLLEPIREFCRKIESSKNNEQTKCYLDAIEAKVKEHQFYEQGSLSILMDLIKRKPNLDDDKLKGIFNIFKIVMNREKFKRSVLVLLYNYLTSSEVNMR